MRKISGFTKPSQANEEAFAAAVDAVTRASSELLSQLRETRAVDIDQSQRGMLTCERAGRGATYSRSSAGDENDLVTKPGVHRGHSTSSVSVGGLL